MEDALGMTAPARPAQSAAISDFGSGTLSRMATNSGPAQHRNYPIRSVCCGKVSGRRMFRSNHIATARRELARRRPAMGDGAGFFLLRDTPGGTVTARDADGTYLPTRVVYSMPSYAMP
jgi:hypothetical protein